MGNLLSISNMPGKLASFIIIPNFIWVKEFKNGPRKFVEDCLRKI